MALAIVGGIGLHGIHSRVRDVIRLARNGGVANLHAWVDEVVGLHAAQRTPSECAIAAP
jgi:hypothetical protein